MVTNHVSFSPALYTALVSLVVFVLSASLNLISRRGRLIGLYGGVLASAGLAAGGLQGLLYPQGSVVQWRGIFDFSSVMFRMDELSAFFVFLLGAAGIFVHVYAIGYVRAYQQVGSVSFLIAGGLVFMATMSSVFLAGNVYTFLLSWEAMSLSSFLLVVYDKRQNPQWAGFIYLVMTHLGTVFLIVAFFVLAHYAHSYSFQSMHAVHMPATAKNLVYLLVLLGFATKAGLVPLHVWLPRAHPVAPSHISALMSGVMIKTAVYGYILVVFQFLSTGPLWWGATTALAGGLSALVGILQALGQSDLKRMLAYSSIENMGLLFLGLGVSWILLMSHHPQLAAFALLAVLYHALNHAAFKSLLFLGAGAVYSQSHTKDMDLLGGLIRSMPWTALFTLVGALSIAAIPPFAGFSSEWMLFLSIFGMATAPDSLWIGVLGVSLLVVLAFTAALVAMAFVRSFGFTFLAVPRSDAARHVREVDMPMKLGMAGLSALCVGLGILPGFWTHVFARPVSLVTGIQPELGHGLSLPLPVAHLASHLSLATVAVAMAAGLALAWLVPRWLGGRTTTARGDTWACGGELAPRMTYTASSYSKPIRVAFGSVLRPSRSLASTGGTHYFPTGYRYASQLSALAEVYLYRPVLFALMKTANLVRTIQNGQVQSYLVYLLAVLILLLLMVK